MLYFNPKPNFKVLSKYYQFPHSVELMEKYYANGYEIVLDHIYTDEAVADLEEGLKSLTTKYNLTADHEDIMFLSLSKVCEHEAVLDELYFQYDLKKRTKELALLLLPFVDASKNKNDSLVVKSLKQKAKVTDNITISWVEETLSNAILSGKMLLKDFEINLRTKFFEETQTGLKLSLSKLTIESKRKVPFPSSGIRTAYADLCLNLYAYLANETEIRPVPGKLFSDAMLNFYFDLLALLGYLKPDEIESDGKDYVGTLLKNRVKKLNPDYQGNK